MAEHAHTTPSGGARTAAIIAFPGRQAAAPVQLPQREIDRVIAGVEAVAEKDLLASAQLAVALAPRQAGQAGQAGPASLALHAMLCLGRFLDGLSCPPDAIGGDA